MRYIFILFLVTFSLNAQVGIGTTTPHPSSALDIQSTDGGLLPPRMDTSQRDAINSGDFAEGLVIYNTDIKCLEFWDGDAWFNVCGSNSNGSGGTGTSGLIPAGSDLINDNFQDGAGNAPFDLQVRNATNDPISWVAVVENRPYSSIPNLVPGDYTVDILDNGDGTFTYTFTGTVPLVPFGNITINGDLPSPAGDSDSSVVSLFIQP